MTFVSFYDIINSIDHSNNTLCSRFATKTCGKASSEVLLLRHNHYIGADEIPVFFSTDDHYVPFLDVALASMIENASKARKYRMIILNTGLKPENEARLKLREREGFAIEFVDMSDELKHIMRYFKNVYHFSIVTYYRLFIASMFPECDKIIYLDCDLVVLGNIAELYDIELGDAIMAAVPDQFVRSTPQFRAYAERAVGVAPDSYINAGVLLLSLERFRQQGIEKRFVELLTKYDFDLIDPDQAYLNYLCRGRILLLPNGWNKIPTDAPCEGGKNIVHYALYKKPWQHDDVTDGESFWRYAVSSRFYEEIKSRRAAFGADERAMSEALVSDILTHADNIVASDYTFVKKLEDR